jgi:hypothetical protein
MCRQDVDFTAEGFNRLTMKTDWILFLGLAAFLVAGLFLVDDYGMNPDSQKNFQEGKLHLDFLLGGPVDQGLLQWQMHGAWIFIAAEASKRLFHDTLHVYDSTAARHIILPFLTAFFLVVLFYFVKRRWDAFHGLLAAGLLLTFPDFWAQTFNNLKDVPLLIFFSLSVMSFVEWTSTRSLRYFYGFFILWGCALATKTYAIFVPVLLLLWLLARPRARASEARFPWPGSILHTVGGLAITATIVLAFFAPAFWGVEGKWSFLQFWHDRVKEITWGRDTPFNLRSFVQVLYRTPLLVLIFAVAGMFKAVREYRTSPLYSLLLLWTLMPLIIPCFPRTLIYHNGMRLFLVFLVPFCLLSSIGIGMIAGILVRRLKTAGRFFAWGIASLTIGASLWGVVTTHPYQTSYFNALAGGLKGAQERDIADCWDYWLYSYREAGRWIDRHGAPNANVVALYASGIPASFNTGLVDDAINRPDLKTHYLPAIPAREGRVAIPGNTYVIYIPFSYFRPGRPLLDRTGQFQKVHTISRQGGEVCTIYYAPPSSWGRDLR